MPEIRRSDRKNRDLIRKWFRSKQGQESLKEAVADDVMMDPQGRPISVMLPEAEVSALGNQPRDLAEDVALALGYGARFGAGMLPFVGEGLDVVEAGKVAATGSDYFGQEADPTMYAGLTAAGLLIPNLLETPLKALKNAGVKTFRDLEHLFFQGQRSEHFSEEAYNAAKEVMDYAQKADLLGQAIQGSIPGRAPLVRVNRPTGGTGLVGGYAQDIPGGWHASPKEGLNDPALSFRNFVIANDPSILAKFDPKVGVTPELEVRLSQLARDFGDVYTTSMRGVDARDAEQAAWYMTSARQGAGGRVLGSGVYSTDRFNIASRYSEGAPQFGQTGYIGKIRSGTIPEGDYKDVINELTSRELMGRAKQTPVPGYPYDTSLGMMTTADVRVTREASDAAIDAALMSSNPSVRAAATGQPVKLLSLTPNTEEALELGGRKLVELPPGGWHGQGNLHALTIPQGSKKLMWDKLGFDYRYGGVIKKK